MSEEKTEKAKLSKEEISAIRRRAALSRKKHAGGRPRKDGKKRTRQNVRSISVSIRDAKVLELYATIVRHSSIRESISGICRSIERKYPECAVSDE